MAEAEKNTKQPFEIALVLAGAVACGSYLAGFLDQFLDALDEWEEKKRSKDRDTPSHDIKIKVISGSSAGGMSAAIFLREAFRRAELRKENPKIKDLSSTSLLKKAWVESIDIKNLLGSRDLIEKDEVESLLDCSKIDEVANEILGKDKKPEWIEVPYFPDDIRLYLTLTNLKGLAYKLKFTSDTNSGHQYINHADYEYFNFNEILSKEKSKWNSHWEKLKERAKATGAFPIALKPREIKERCFDFYKNRLKDEGRGLEKHLDVNEEGDYSFYSIDGGTINNEPFDLAKSVWAVKDKDGNLVKKGELVPGQSCILMVDPFPGEGIAETHSSDSRWFYSFVPDLISTLLNQSRFRADELTAWSEKEVGTRFLVMPRKEENGIISTKPLKGGFLGGFGGFFSEKFRKHDYELGKANCQSFLENYFSLPTEIASKGGVLTDSKSITIKGNKSEKQVVPIIPFKRKDGNPEKSSTLDNQKDGEVKLNENEFTKIKNQLDSRLRAVLSRVPIPFPFLFHPISLIIPLLYIGLYLLNVGFDCINLHLAGEFLNVLILLVMLAVFIGAVIYRVVPGLILKKLSDGLRKSMEDWGVLNPPKPN